MRNDFRLGVYGKITITGSMTARYHYLISKV
jgi:hypothetical protein